MKNYLEKEEYTYVLFGKEAIDLYNVSLKLLLSSTTYVDYKVNSYNDVKDFMFDQKNWDGFIEIPESDYMQIKKNAVKSRLLKDEVMLGKKRKAFSILNLFKD